MSDTHQIIDPPVRPAPVVRLRKVMRIGASRAVTIDPAWAKANVAPDVPYVATSVWGDGSFRVYPASQPPDRTPGLHDPVGGD